MELGADGVQPRRQVRDEPKNATRRRRSRTLISIPAEEDIEISRQPGRNAGARDRRADHPPGARRADPSEEMSVPLHQDLRLHQKSLLHYHGAVRCGQRQPVPRIRFSQEPMRSCPEKNHERPRNRSLRYRPSSARRNCAANAARCRYNARQGRAAACFENGYSEIFPIFGYRFCLILSINRNLSYEGNRSQKLPGTGNELRVLRHEHQNKPCGNCRSRRRIGEFRIQPAVGRIRRIAVRAAADTAPPSSFGIRPDHRRTGRGGTGSRPNATATCACGTTPIGAWLFSLPIVVIAMLFMHMPYGNWIMLVRVAAGIVLLRARLFRQRMETTAPPAGQHGYAGGPRPRRSLTCSACSTPFTRSSGSGADSNRTSITKPPA